MSSVFITSISQVSSLGDGMDSFWDGLLAGTSGASATANIKDIDFSSMRIPYCHVLGSDRLKIPQRKELEVRKENRALLDMLFLELDSNARIDGIIWGNGQVGMPTDPSLSVGEWQNDVQDSARIAFNCSIHSSQIFGLSVTCNTGIAALGAAAERIASGQWHSAIVVVQEIRCRHHVLLPYYKLNLLDRSGTTPQNSMRPFALDRDGFVKGEGGCAFLLQSEHSLQQSKREPICRIGGYAIRSAHRHIFESGSDTESAVVAIKQAIHSAGLLESDIDYINLYGSGSRKNDAFECQAIKNAFDNRYRDIPCSSLKPYFGHLNQASSAIETAATALMLKNHRVVNNLGLQNVDPRCDLNLPTNLTGSVTLRHALKVSFGFGWTHGAIVLSAC